MRRIIYQRLKPHKRVVHTHPIIIDVEPIKPEAVEKETIMPFVISHEEEIIAYIKEKAIKEIFIYLSPLLEKLEEGVKQQQSQQQESQETSLQGGLLPMDSGDRLKSLQESFKMKEMKVAKRMSQLQAKFANMRR